MFMLIIAAALFFSFIEYMTMKKAHQYREIMVSACFLMIGLVMGVLRLLGVKLPSIFLISVNGLLSPLHNWMMKWFH